MYKLFSPKPLAAFFQEVYYTLQKKNLAKKTQGLLSQESQGRRPWLSFERRRREITSYCLYINISIASMLDAYPTIALRTPHSYQKCKAISA